MPIIALVTLVSPEETIWEGTGANKCAKFLRVRVSSIDQQDIEHARLLPGSRPSPHE